jgi:hypothetical protein
MGKNVIIAFFKFQNDLQFERLRKTTNNLIKNIVSMTIFESTFYILLSTASNHYVSRYSESFAMDRRCFFE